MVARQPSLVVEDDSWLDKTLREEEKWIHLETKSLQC
jgi:hypothetical protein